MIEINGHGRFFTPTSVEISLSYADRRKKQSFLRVTQTRATGAGFCHKLRRCCPK